MPNRVRSILPRAILTLKALYTIDNADASLAARRGAIYNGSRFHCVTTSCDVRRPTALLYKQPTSTSRQGRQ